MRRLDHITAAKEEAIRLGATIEIERTKSNHACGIISINGKKRKIFFSGTPRDKKVCYVTKEDVRKKIKEMIG